MRNDGQRERPLLVLIALDIITLNPVSRRVTAFAEGPVGTRIRGEVRKTAVRARTGARDAAARTLQRVMKRITF